MMEQLIPLYYSDAWTDEAHLSDRSLVHECLLRARNSLPFALWDCLTKDGFHDAYIQQVEVSGASGQSSAIVTIRRPAKMLRLAFSDLIDCKWTGSIVDANACFPPTRAGKALAQILDVWVEADDMLHFYFLLDNGRTLSLTCHATEEAVQFI